MDDIPLGSYAPLDSESAPSDSKFLDLLHLVSILTELGEQQWDSDAESKSVEIELEGVRVKFPFQPYSCQEDLMRHVPRRGSWDGGQSNTYRVDHKSP